MLDYFKLSNNYWHWFSKYVSSIILNIFQVRGQTVDFSNSKATLCVCVCVCMCVCVLVVQSCLTLGNPMDCSLPAPLAMESYRQEY